MIYATWWFEDGCTSDWGWSWADGTRLFSRSWGNPIGVVSQ